MRLDGSTLGEHRHSDMPVECQARPWVTSEPSNDVEILSGGFLSRATLPGQVGAGSLVVVAEIFSIIEV